MQQRTKTSINDDAQNVPLAKLGPILECIPDPVLVVKSDGKIAYINRHAEMLFGYRRDELVDKPLEILLPERPREEHTQHVQHFTHRLALRPMDSRLKILAKHKEGKEIPVDIALAPIGIDGTTHVIATIRDQTEHRQTLEGLEERKELYRRLLADSTQGFWRLVFDDPVPLDLPEMEQVDRLMQEAYLTDTNLTFSRQYGFNEEGAMDGVRVEGLVSREDPATIPMLLEIVRARYQMPSLVTFEHDRHGSEKVFENSFFGDIVDGKVRSIWGTSRDITKRYWTEREARIKNAAIESMIDGCVVVDAKADDLPIVYANQRFCEITGYSREEFMEKNCRFLQGPDTDPMVVRRIGKCLGRGIPFEGEILNYRKDGTPFLNQLRISLVRDRVGDVARFVGIVRDITKERQVSHEMLALKQTLSHISRVATMGELTATIAHEINQPLTAIYNNADAALRLMNTDTPDLDELREVLNDIIEDDQRATEIIRNMHALLKKEQITTEPLDINEVVQEIVHLLHSEAVFKNVAVVPDLAEDLPPVLANRVQLQQVLLNLISNGFDAMEEMPESERRLELRTARYGGSDVLLSVQDAGHGLEGQEGEQLFAPFYSTKSKGLGMGLAITRSIVEAIGGKVWAENNDGRGATFHIRLTEGNQSENM
jgi:PAS domain S-box-containing protein